MSLNPRFAMLRATALALLCGLALLVTAGPAAAHTRLLGSDPADGASLDAGPQRVSLEFNEAMTPDFSTITVVGPDGAEYHTGDVAAQANVASVGVSPLGPPGRYEIGYRVVSEDGHSVTGRLGFTLTTAGPGAEPAVTPGATAPADAAPAVPADDGGMPVWPWILGAVVLIGGGIGAVLRLGR